MKYILIVINFIILILSILWVYSSPSYEPLIACFVAIAVLAGFIIDGEKSKDKKTKISNLAHEMLENYNVAKSAEPWTYYSLNHRILIEELNKELGEELYKSIQQVYIKMEQTNTKTRNIARGMWSENAKTSHYVKMAIEFETIIVKLKKNKIFKKYFA